MSDRLLYAIVVGLSGGGLTYLIILVQRAAWRTAEHLHYRRYVRRYYRRF